ncbi:hypothetical protein QYZ45_27740 [Vibrio parahaemolyticus]|nr:hypothetical protein [Vibrio parahaemolyticus]
MGIGKSLSKKEEYYSTVRLFDVAVEFLEHGIRSESELKESKNADYHNEIKTIPFYHHVNATAGNGVCNSNESHRFIHIKDLPCLDIQSLFALQHQEIVWSL